MSCLYPLPAYYSSNLSPNGKFPLIVLPRTPSNLKQYSMRSSCGKCVSCRLRKSRDWAFRCMHEADMHERNCFITLTYNDAHLPPYGTLLKRDVQLFMKRLRKRFGEGIRYYYAGEYGPKLGRPHYHILLFGHNFDFDKYKWMTSPAGFDLYRSPSLEEIWSIKGRSIGYSSVADLTFDSAGYVARYCMTKIGGDAALSHYSVFDSDTGEVLFDRLPEFNDMSRRSGIGSSWFDKHSSDVYPADHVIVKRREYPPPRYYDRRLELIDPDMLISIKEVRTKKIVKVPESRLAGMRKFKQAQVNLLVRKI
nr:MAG: replication initiator protein [Microviridae sp.]